MWDIIHVALVTITIHCKFRIIIISCCVSRRFTIMLVLKVLQMSLMYCQYLVWGVVLLPSANEVCEDYVFTRVCLSTEGGGVMNLLDLL